MAEYKTPGVYIEEIPHLPPSIASVETAIPVFIGYTELAKWKQPEDLRNTPRRIESMLQYETYFGKAEPEKQGLEVVFDNSGSNLDVRASADPKLRSKYLMYYSLQMFFINGGGPCWIVSIGDYEKTAGVIGDDDLARGLEKIKKIDEITLIVFPDAVNLAKAATYYSLYSQAITQCHDLQDRFVVMDVYHDINNEANGEDDWSADIEFLRSNLAGTTDFLKYAAVYFPWIYTNIDFAVNEATVKITSKNAGELPPTLAELQAKNNAYYNMAKGAVRDLEMLLPAAAAVVGVYARVDESRGVWKAPANEIINNTTRTKTLITNEEQKGLNVDAQEGKSVNVIRSFPGKGQAIIWGARTLAGNDNEWRYVPVRRYFNMVEESVKNATGQFVFEPNDENTWVRVKSMIANYLTQQWKAGALQGASVKEAFFVHIGLGETMTELDLWEGRLIIEIGMAVVRPAEFIILRFMHKMLAES